jgi:hypothetical protein
MALAIRVTGDAEACHTVSCAVKGQYERCRRLEGTVTGIILY